ncbi:unnamed protein product [Caenorhabditis nigoni]
MSAAKCPSLPTDPLAPCTVTFVTQNDRANEPPPQPRVRKVTTIINTLGIIVEDNDTEVGVWVFTACEKKFFPKADQHMFIGIHLGTWIIVGIYPDGTVASYSPWPLLLQAYETKVIENQLLLKICASDMHHEKTVRYDEVVAPCKVDASTKFFERDPQLTAEFYKIPGLGRVLAPTVFRSNLEDKNGRLSIWIQYCGRVVRECSWMVFYLEEKSHDGNEYREKELRVISEFIKEKRSQLEILRCPDKYMSRNLGLITEVHSNKHTLNFWSPFVPIETDHTARIPQPPKHREVESPMLDPMIGQWIQFDVHSKDLEKYIGTKPGFRLQVQEYLPVNSPCGIGVVNVNKTIRVAVSCILVTGTDHPMLYQLPTFGFVIDRNSTLVSGAHMQLILEKISPKLRRSSSACWSVISSKVVNFSDVTVEKVKDMQTEAIPLKDAMEPCSVISIEKQNHSSQSKPQQALQVQAVPMLSASVNTGITMLKYQQPQSQIQYLHQGRDYYIGNTIRLPSNYSSSTKKFTKSRVFLENTLEGHAIVEKYIPERQAGILWLFDNFNTSVHFIYDEFEFEIGDYVYVKLEKKSDPMQQLGFRWLWKSGVKKEAPFNCRVNKNQIYIETKVTLGTPNRQNRTTYTSKHFPTVLDVDSCISTPTAGVTYSAVIYRKRITDPVTDIGRFQWTIYALQGTSYMVADYYHSNYQFHNRSNLKNVPPQNVGISSASSEHSSTSPPLKRSSITSDES